MTDRDTAGDRQSNRTTERTPSADDASSGTGGTTERTVGITAIVVGSSASIETTDISAQESETEAEPPPGHLVLLPVSEYRPGLTVRVVDRLPAPIVVPLLQLPNGETVSVLEQPDEYTGYVARAESGDDLVRSTMILFTRESLETDARYAFENDSQVFSTRLNLFRATARPLEAGEDPADVLEGDGSGTETESDDQ